MDKTVTCSVQQNPLLHKSRLPMQQSKMLNILQFIGLDFQPSNNDNSRQAQWMNELDE